MVPVHPLMISVHPLMVPVHMMTSFDELCGIVGTILLARVSDIHPINNVRK